MAGGDEECVGHAGAVVGTSGAFRWAQVQVSSGLVQVAQRSLQCWSLMGVFYIFWKWEKLMREGLYCSVSSHGNPTIFSSLVGCFSLVG